MSRMRRLGLENLEHRRVLAASLGWDGPGFGSAELGYHIGNVPASFSLSQQEVEAAIETALAAWSNAVDIAFKPVATSGQSNSLDITFVSLDGPGGTLARAWLPADVNRARIAGDIQFDVTDQYEVGDAKGSAAFDFVWVAVHEIGHALGLDHSHAGDAVLMPFVGPRQAFTELSADDIAAIQKLYAAATQPEGEPQLAGEMQVETTDHSAEEEIDTEVETDDDDDDAGRLPGGTVNTSGNDPSNNDAGQNDADTVTTSTNDSETNEERPDCGDSKRMRPPLSNGSPLINRFDADADGSLAHSEVPDKVWSQLVDELAADANADALVSADELAAALMSARAAWFVATDVNQDNVIDVNEVNRHLWNRIVNADSDQSDSVSLDELETWVTETGGVTPRMVHRHESHHRHGRGNESRLS